MVKKIKLCDRCGRECEIVRISKYKVYYFNGDQFDLCQKCFNDLNDWIKQRKAESEDINADR